MLSVTFNLHHVTLQPCWVGLLKKTVQLEWHFLLRVCYFKNKWWQQMVGEAQHDRLLMYNFPQQADLAQCRPLRGITWTQTRRDRQYTNSSFIPWFSASQWSVFKQQTGKGLKRTRGADPCRRSVWNGFPGMTAVTRTVCEPLSLQNVQGDSSHTHTVHTHTPSPLCPDQWGASRESITTAVCSVSVRLNSSLALCCVTVSFKLFNHCFVQTLM